MRAANSILAVEFLAHARHSLTRHHLPRIGRCLKLLAGREIWWRGNSASNSVGNLVLHLEGNVRQWIISGVGGAPDRRDRHREFAERGPIPRRKLFAHLERTVVEACGVLIQQSPGDLARVRTIQGFRVTGFKAVAHVIEHFAYHTGQIAYATKLLRRRDLKFTRLPGRNPKWSFRGKLPTI
ncbi:MAG: DUF1572 family protein [Acidobacteria bacterium]|nr:DUF1572 family protein [Acidobacteriota bacterium]